MIGANAKLTANTKPLRDATGKAAYRNIRHALASIRKDARDSMREARGPSAPGSPPNVHRGRLRAAILYDYDKAAQSGVVGPRYQTGKGRGYPPLIGRIHEFGGTVGGLTEEQLRASKRSTKRKSVARTYPARPFMRPAMDRALQRMANDWRSSITS